MPRPSAKRAELMTALERATKTLSAQNLAVSQAIAERLGINVSDLECLTMARAAGDNGVTAGDLAAATALTSGAITGVIDRLEHAGLVRRDRDTNDRRKVIVRPTENVEKTVPPLFEPLHCSMTEIWTSYTDDQLALILDFLTRARDVMRAEGAALRGTQHSDTARKRHPGKSEEFASENRYIENNQISYHASSHKGRGERD